MRYREVISLYDRKNGEVIEHSVYVEAVTEGLPERIVYEQPTGPGTIYRKRYTAEEARAVVAALEGAIQAVETE